MRDDVRVWFFDCDGVILDSNAAKTEAFWAVASPYGEEAAEALVRHHVANGGVSRWSKLEFLFNSILERPPRDGEFDVLVDRFGEHSRQALATAGLDTALVPLLNHLNAQGDRSFVVSGGHQGEVRSELQRRGIADLFEGVFGSPRDKSDVVAEVLSDTGLEPTRAMFVGDGRRDWETARALGLGFTFVRHWSEWQDWEAASDGTWLVVEDLDELFELVRSTASASARSSDA